MITKDQLNEDQRKSFNQMTTEAEVSEEKALGLIDELCIQKGLTGLRIKGRFQLTPKGQAVANALRK